MFGISFAELVIILILVLVVMGPEKLPEVARWAGKGLRELRQASNTLRNALEVEDLETSSRSGANRIGQNSSASTSSSKSSKASAAANSPNSDSPSSTSSANNSSSPTSGGEPTPPSNLDQIDDERFDKMLQQQLQNRGDELDDVELPDARQSTESTDVELAALQDQALHSLYDVALPTTASAEAA